METPHLPVALFGQYFTRTVYEPAEDTFLLLDALEADLMLIQDIDPLICLEIGCGSGTVITSLVKALGNQKRLYLATDINPDALQCTRKCSQLNLGISAAKEATTNSSNSEFIQLVQTNLATAFEPKLNSNIDLLVFNPPYVPTPTDEIQPGLAASWAGGTSGREIIDHFLHRTLPRMLSQAGAAYLVVLEANDIKQLSEEATKIGFKTSQVLTRRCGIERLSVLRFRRL